VVDDDTIAVIVKESYYAILQDLTLIQPFRFYLLQLFLPAEVPLTD
jgi:hypothetical protein